MRFIFKLLFSLPLIILMLAIVVINIKLEYSPERKTIDKIVINNDLLKELRGIKKSLDNNADLKMQGLYPEGFVFMNAIYGLAWCNAIENLNKDSGEFREGKAEIQKAFSKINSEQGRSSFNEELSLLYGSFYTGWSSYLLGRKLSLEDPKERNDAEVDLFKRQCANISVAVAKRVYPASYYGSAWPADVVMCMTSLALHDKLFAPAYSTTIGEWLTGVKKNLDENGLIPHSADALNSKPTEQARGSSQSLMLLFLGEFDKKFARHQFALYQEKFVDDMVGLTGIREYPKGTYGTGDVDSGPVIFQFGAAATIVGMQTLSTYDDNGKSIQIRNALEAVSFPTEFENEKTYLFGTLPIANAFIAWGHSAMPVTKEVNPNFSTFRFYSILIFVLLATFFWILIKPDKPRPLQVLW